MRYNKGIHFNCPHCQHVSEDPVEDYTLLPDRPVYGIRTTQVDECDQCGNGIRVTRISEDVWEVEPEL